MDSFSASIFSGVYEVITFPSATYSPIRDVTPAMPVAETVVNRAESPASPFRLIKESSLDSPNTNFSKSVADPSSATHFSYALVNPVSVPLVTAVGAVTDMTRAWEFVKVV